MKIHVLYGQTEGLTDEQMEDKMEGQREERSGMTKLIVVFRSFLNATAMLPIC
jgi:hypothetical protein